MKFRSSIALCAVAATLAIPAAAQAKTKAKAKPHKHVVAEHGLTATQQLELAQQQIAQMQAQLNNLQAKLEQAPAPAPQTQAQFAQVQAQADAAVAKADKALAIADQTKTAQAKTEKSVSAMSWAGDTKISGRMYFNFSNIDQQASGQKTSGSGTGFDIKRLYVGIDHKFNKVFAFNVTTDVSNVVGSTSNYNYGTTGSTPVGRGFFIKKAYVEAKINPALIIRAGSADLPWVANDENIYGYRHIEQTIVDGPYGTSADWGIHALGKLGKYVDYQVAVIDGGGYRNVKVTKNVDMEGRVGLNVDGVFADVGGYIGKRGGGVDSALAPTIAYKTAHRFNAMGGFKNDKFTIGGEYFYAWNWNSITSQANEDRGQGFTVFGNYNITKKWSAFGEYQWVKATTSTSGVSTGDVRNHYFNVGIQFEPVKILDLALVFKRAAVDNGNYSSVNGSYGSAYSTGIGCGTATVKPCDGTYNEIGIFGQVRF